MKKKCVVIGTRKPIHMDEMGAIPPFLVRGLKNGNAIFMGDFEEAVDIAEIWTSV